MRGRRIGIGALLVLGTLFWTFFGIGLWAQRQALDTDEWVDTSTELLENEEIRTALGVYLVDQLYQSADVQDRIEEALPPRARPPRRTRGGRAEGGCEPQRSAAARQRGRDQGLEGGEPRGTRPAARGHRRGRRRCGAQARRAPGPDRRGQRTARRHRRPAPARNLPRFRWRAPMSSTRYAGRRSIRSARMGPARAGAPVLRGCAGAVARPPPHGGHRRRLPHLRRRADPGDPPPDRDLAGRLARRGPERAGRGRRRLGHRHLAARGHRLGLDPVRLLHRHRRPGWPERAGGPRTPAGWSRPRCASTRAPCARGSAWRSCCS